MRTVWEQSEMRTLALADTHHHVVVFCLKDESSYLGLPKQLCMGGDDGLTCRMSARFRRTQSEKVVLQARPFDLES